MNEQAIWSFLMEKIQNPVGVAALMGNLYIESKLNPKLVQSSYARKYNTTSEEYTAAVDKTHSETFATDGAGYGLVQWTYKTRKANLLKFAIEKKTSIGDLNMQLEFLWKELQGYKTVLTALKEGTEVRAVSDVVAKRYEKPADTSEFALINRAYYGQKFFDEYNTKTLKKVQAIKNVNIRVGNNTKYNKVGVLKKDKTLPWVATSENEWHAVEYENAVCWISGEFSKVTT